MKSYRERDELRMKYDVLEQNYQEVALKYEECNRENMFLSSKISQLEQEKNIRAQVIHEPHQVITCEENKTHHFLRKDLILDPTHFRLNFLKPTAYPMVTLNSNQIMKNYAFLNPFEDINSIEVMKRLSPELNAVCSIFQSKEPKLNQGFIKIKDSS